MTSNASLTYNRRRRQRQAVATVGGLPEKRPRSGHNVSHAQNKTKRLFKPNLQRTRVLVDGRLVSVRLDTRTMRSITKAIKPRPNKKAPTGQTKAAGKGTARKRPASRKKK